MKSNIETSLAPSGIIPGEWAYQAAVAGRDLAMLERDSLKKALKEIGEIAENCLHGPTPQIATQTFASPIRSIRRIAFEAVDSKAA